MNDNKLYTEEQLRNSMLSMKTYINMYDESVIDRIIENHIKALGVVKLPSDSLCINCDLSKSTHNVCMDCMIKIGKENIELPSDEEIEEYADSVMPYAEKIGGETYTAYRAIKLGAKWMRKIVQEGNNEQ